MHAALKKISWKIFLWFHPECVMVVLRGGVILRRELDWSENPPTRWDKLVSAGMENIPAAERDPRSPTGRKVSDPVE